MYEGERKKSGSGAPASKPCYFHVYHQKTVHKELEKLDVVAIDLVIGMIVRLIGVDLPANLKRVDLVRDFVDMPPCLGKGRVPI